MKSENPDFSEESSKRAASADANSQPIDPEIVGDSPGNPPIDPALMHGLMVNMVRGLVLRIDRMAGWSDHPNYDWYESTTQCLEILIRKYGGGVGASPEGVLIFFLVAWIAPNVITTAALGKKSEDAAAETPKTETAAAAPISEPHDILKTPIFPTPLEDVPSL